MFGLGLPELLILLFLCLFGLYFLRKRSARRSALLAATAAPEMSFPQQYTFKKDPTALTSFLKIMLWTCMGTVVLVLVSNIMQMNLINALTINMTEAQSNDQRQRIVGLINVAVSVLTYITFLVWVYRANFNSHGFGARDMKFSPAGAVGFYFIPILNLVWPYRAMSEIWKISRNPAGWQNQPGSSLLGWWWAMFIIAAILGWISLAMAGQAKTLTALKDMTTAAIMADVAYIASYLLDLALVSAISKQQKRLTEIQVAPSITTI